MPKLEVPSDLAEHFAKALGWKMQLVNEIFDFEEEKDGYFIARIKRKNALSTIDFKTLCSLSRDLGGDYVKGTGKFRIPGLRQKT